MMQTTQYFTSVFWQFVHNLKIGKKVVLSTIYDLAFWLLFFGITYLVGVLLKKESTLLGKISFDQQAILASQTLAETNVTLINTFLIKSTLLIILLAIIVLIIYTIMKGLIWNTLFDKKPTKKYFVQFFKLNLLWFAIWLLPTLFVLLGAQPKWRNYLAIILAILYLHLTTVLQTVFTQKEKIKDALNASIQTGFGKIHHFICPYILSVLFYLLLTRILYLLPAQSIALLTSAIIMWVFSIAWFRNYVKDVILTPE